MQGLWCKPCCLNCDVFKSRSIQKKWATAKKQETILCYRCLGDDHLGGECPRSRVCNIDGCRDRHNRLLHGNRNGTKPQFRPLESQPSGTQLQGTQSQETQPQANQPQPNQPQLTRTIQGKREVQSNRNDNTLAQGAQGQGTGSTLSTEGDANINSTTLKINKKRHRQIQWHCELFQQS